MLKDKVKEIIDEKYKEYNEFYKNIVNNYHDEINIARDYAGRQIFELLQNADDEMVSDNQGKVLISYEDNLLQVSNTGSPFSEKGFDSIINAHLSAKTNLQGRMGYKGLGFRANTTWAEEIKILTEEFGLVFSKEIAKRKYNEILKNHPEFKEKIKGYDSTTDYPVAILPLPDMIDETSKDYVTTIKIKCKNSLNDEIEQQLKEIQMEEFVLLPNITEVEIKSRDYHKLFKKQPKNNFVVVTEKDLNTNEEKSVEWEIFTKTGEIEFFDNGELKKQTYEFKIAYDKISHRAGNFLYSYFRTNIALSFPAIVHGTFELKSDRNHLVTDGVDGQKNKQLMGILADFMVETAVKLSQTGEPSYEPLKLIVNSNMDSELKNKFDLYNLLVKKAKEQAIFPTIDKRYISLKDSPYYMRKNYAKYLNKEVFKNLLLHCEDEEIRIFINECQIPRYSYEELVDLINEKPEEYTLEERCQIIKLFYEDFSYKDNKKLNLLLDINNQPITSDSITVFSNADDKNVPKDLPKWAEMTFISKDMQQTLIDLFDVSKQRELIVEDLKNLIMLREYSLVSLIGSLNSQADTNEKKIDILNWLWGSFETLYSNNDTTTIKINVPCRDGVFRDKSDCYLGKEYGNDLSEKLCGEYNFVASPKYFNFKDFSEDKVQRFFNWLHINKFPKVIYEDVKDEDAVNFYKKQFAEYYNVETYDVRSMLSIKVGSFDNLEQILEKANINDIIAWCIIDNNLKMRLFNDMEILNDESLLKGRISHKKNDTYMSYRFIKSYLLYVFQNCKWINGYKPEMCCFESIGNSSVVFKPQYDVGKIKETVLKYVPNYSSSIQTEIDNFFSRIGVKSKFEDLSSDVFYQILLNLPNDDPDIKFAQSLYGKVKNKLASSDIPQTPNYLKFIKEGIVPVSINGIKKYVPNKEAYYASNHMYSKKILEDFPMLLASARIGDARTKELFGVQKLTEINLKLNEEPIFNQLNDSFKQDYKKLLPYVYVIRKSRKNKEKTEDLTNLKNTIVNVCNKVAVSYCLNDEIITKELEDYDIIYLKQEKNAYIKVPNKYNSYVELKTDAKFASAVAEVITNIVDVEEFETTYSYLYGLNESNREFVLKKEIGETDVDEIGEAKRKFQVFDHKLEFWSNIAELRDFKVDDEQDVADFIKKYEIQQEIVDGLNYNELSDVNNCENIINLFKKLDIDISNYNNNKFNGISLINYYKNKIEELKSQYKDKYKEHLYLTLKEDDDCVEKFIKYVNSYNSDKYEIENSVNFNYVKEFEKKNGVKIDDLKNLNVSIDETIEKNIKQNQENFSSSNVDQVKKQIYALFNKFEKLEEVASLMTEEENIDLSTYTIEVTEGLSSVQSNKTLSERKPYQVANNGNSSNNFDEAKQKVKIEKGKRAEDIVEKYLKDKGYSRVTRYSGNNKDQLIEANDALGYDISYIDENNHIQYVEVKSKSALNDYSFELSENQLKTAMNNKKNYHIYFVHIDKQTMKVEITKFERLFDVDDELIYQDNDSYIIKPTKFEIKPQKID